MRGSWQIIEWAIYKIGFWKTIKISRGNVNWVRKEWAKSNSLRACSSAALEIRFCRGNETGSNHVLCTMIEFSLTRYSIRVQRAEWTCNTYSCSTLFLPNHQLYSKWKSFLCSPLMSAGKGKHMQSFFNAQDDDVIIIVTFQKLMGFSGMRSAWRKHRLQARDQHDC